MLHSTSTRTLTRFWFRALLGGIVFVCLMSVSRSVPLPEPAKGAAKPVVLIVGNGNMVLDTFFDIGEIKRDADVRRLKPADLKDEAKYLKPARDGQFRLIIFDRCGPEKTEHLPIANTVFIGYLPPPWKVADLPKVKNPQVLSWNKDSPVLKSVTALHEIGIEEAFQVKNLPPDAALLINKPADPVLMFSLKRGKQTDLVVTFSLLNDKNEWNTNWPLKLSFPLFLRNLLLVNGISDTDSKRE